MAGNFWIHLATAAIYVQLGRERDAGNAVAQLLALDPDFARHGRALIEAWHYASGLALLAVLLLITGLALHRARP